jgi:hypothetical protein
LGTRQHSPLQTFVLLHKLLDDGGPKLLLEHHQNLSIRRFTFIDFKAQHFDSIAIEAGTPLGTDTPKTGFGRRHTWW